MHDIRTSREIFRTPVVLRIDLSAPINNVIQQRVGIRVIVMHFDHQAVRNHILRELAHRHHFATAVHTCRWPLNHERTAGVVATRCTHGVHKRLVVRHQDFGFVLVIVVRCRRLVSACEKQVFIVIFEAVCDLRPEILLAGIHLVLFLIVQVAFKPAVIPMDVQNRHEACAHTHIHNRLHRIHPARRNFVRATARNNVRPARIARQGIRMAVPRTRNTDRAEARRLDRINVRFSRELVTPPCRILGNFHCVPDIYAKAHLGKHFVCRRQICREGI